jgi:hypothetical protein
VRFEHPHRARCESPRLLWTVRAVRHGVPRGAQVAPFPRKLQARQQVGAEVWTDSYRRDGPAVWFASHAPWQLARGRGQAGRSIRLRFGSKCLLEVPGMTLAQLSRRRITDEW